MTLSQAEFARIDRTLSTVIERSGEFSSFDVDFAMTNAERLDRFGLRTSFSVGQWDALARIENRLQEIDGEG